MELKGKEMSEEHPQIADPDVLAAEIGEILASGSLYRSFIYTGTKCHFTNNRGAVNMPRYGALPRLKMFCARPACNARTWWDADSYEYYFKTSIQARTYKCRNCGQNWQHYYLI
jgi:hypothetical protein